MNDSPSTDPETGTPRLSAVVITRNEAHNLPRLLASLEGVADEVVVYDSGSEDGTVELARRAGARVVSCEWKGWSATKNAANADAWGTWILSLDADEALTPEVARAVLGHIAGPVRTEAGAWRVGEINRLTRYVDRWVRHSGWHPDRKVRLWPAGAGQWEGTIHEAMSFDGPVDIHRLKGVVEHHSYPTVADHLSQIERFGAVWAQGQFEAGRKSHVALAMLKVCAQWVKTALLRGGFRDGATGWAIARRSAWATWRKHARLRGLHRPPAPPQRILIARTDALGDVVCTLPVARAVRTRYPDARVDLLVRPYAAPIAEHAIGVDHVVHWTPEDAEQPRSVGAQRLRSGKYDTVVFAFPDRGVVMAARAAGIPRRIGTGRRGHTLFRLTHCNWDGRRHSGGHEAWHGLRLLLPLDIGPDPAFRRDIGLTVPDLEVTGSPPWKDMPPGGVLLHPGSHGSAGNWPAEHFSELAKDLAESGIPVGFTGTASEGEVFGDLVPDHPLVHRFFGALDLRELLVLQARSGLVIASSTGPLHTAASLGVPVLGLYHTAAPAWPERWAPIGPRAAVLTTDRLTPEGQLELSVAEVFTSAMDVLKPAPEGTSAGPGTTPQG